MTLLHEAVESKKFDVRLIERNIARNVITADDATKVAAKLPDDAENAEWIAIDTIKNDGSESSDG